MTTHLISIQAQQATVRASTLAELLQQTGTKIMQFKVGMGINHRTAQRRMKEPETMTIKELLDLAALLRVPEQQLLDLIRDEYRARPAPPQADAAAPAEDPAEEKAPVPKAAAKKLDKA